MTELTRAMLAPATVLVAWSVLMLIWVAATRFPAMSKAGIDLSKRPPGGRGQDLEGVLPPNVSWKSHNYAHLMEQPTLFYAMSAILAILGPTALDVRFAWGYAGLRIAHSLWQALVNRIPVRFALFMAATLCLVAMTVSALGKVFA